LGGKAIKIAGGGISGLTAAIQLRLFGYDVEVHERKGHCGKDTNDFQFLENWSFQEDVLDFLRQINIHTNFYIKPWFSQEFLSPSLRVYIGRSAKPLMYLVKGGRGDDSIDRCLEEQVKSLGIRIRFRSRLEPANAHVVATGFSKPAFLVTGITFPFQQPDRSIVLLDDTLSSRCYSYFIVNDRTAEIACVNPVGFKDHQERLQKTVNRFEQVLGHSIGDIQDRFSSVINFGFMGAFRRRSRCFVGEAAGFQDHLAGFGMVYAFRSGYWAARSIMGYGKYDTLWKKDFGRQLRISCWNRLLYNRLSNRSYEGLIDILESRHPVIRWLRGGDDFRLMIRRVYTRSFLLRVGPLLFWKSMGRIRRENLS
jgi:hypothetical protein